MASRRMFSKRLISSAKFLKMPKSSQCLYFHLGMNADDDGIVEAYTVMSSTGTSEDDLEPLVEKGFVQILNDDMVAYITDWNENNKIRADRKIDSIYKDLLMQVLPDVQIKEKRIRADVAKKMTTAGCPLDNQWTTNGQPMDGIGKDRTGQGSLGQDRVVEDREGQETPDPFPSCYGKYQNVILSADDLETLKNDFPDDYDKRIEKLSAYMKSTGKTYENHFATIQYWAEQDKEKQKNEKQTPNKPQGSNPFLNMARDKGLI